jgi:hypothetical protein
MSDYTLGKAQQDRSNRLAYTNTMNALMRSPGAVSPSDKSVWAGWGGKLLEPVVKGAGPDIYSGVKKKATDWWNTTPQQLSNQYQSLGDSGIGASGTGLSAGGTDSWPGMDYDAYSGLGGDLGDWGDYADWGTYGADWASTGADVASNVAGAYGGVDPDVFANLFNSGFAGW